MNRGSEGTVTPALVSPSTVVYRPRRPVRWGRIARIIARYIALILISIIFAFPFYWVILTSLASPDHVFDFPPSLWPRWDFQNYADAWNGTPWLNYFINTGFIAVATTILVLFTSTLAGYAFAVMSFRGKRFFLAVVFLTLIMPAVVLIIPDYVIANELHWLNTYTVQIVPWGASTFGIFLMMQYFRGLPTEFWDAARIDGCTRLRYLWSIGFPLSLAMQATIGLFTFLGSYNSLLWPLVMTSTNGASAGVQPIEVGVYSFVSNNGTMYNLLCAATVFTTVPVVIIFLFLQRTFVRGVTRTGIKG